VGKKRILIVEDESLLAMNIQRLLNRLGYDAFQTVSRGENAVEIADRERPDLIMMDIHLKGKMDGLETAERIRKFLDVPVIYTTAYSDDETLERAQKTSSSVVLMKPYEISDLRSAIEAGFVQRRPVWNSFGYGDSGYPREFPASEKASFVPATLQLSHTVITETAGEGSETSVH
jgi:two-component system, response regulator PdtaR